MRTALVGEPHRVSVAGDLVKESLDRARIHAASVDVGTGSGFVAAGLAPHAAHVVGLNNSPGMLDAARRNLDQFGITNVELAEADVHALPLPDDNADAAVAVANIVLHQAEEPTAMLAEMARVTRPGGWVAITGQVDHPYE